jgi:hypothetical protein
VKILGFLLKESHDRVRARAERTLLVLGSEKCDDSTLTEQRERLEKQYRTQLLRAAEANKDLDAEWLGVDMKKIDPMHEIMTKVTEDDEGESTIETEDSPVGFTLADIVSKAQDDEVPVVEGEDKAVLLSALLGAQKKSVEENDTSVETDSDLPLDPTIPPTSRFLLLLQRMSEKVGKDVPVNDLLTKAEESGMDEFEFEDAMIELEKQGIIYKSSKGTVSYVDIEL